MPLDSTFHGSCAFTCPVLTNSSGAGMPLKVTLTLLRVVESGFAQLPGDAYRKAYDGNTQGWASELGELAGYLDAA